MRAAALSLLAVAAASAALAAPNPYPYQFERIQSLAERPIQHPEVDKRQTEAFRRCLAQPDLSTMTQDSCLQDEMKRQDDALNRQWAKTLSQLKAASVTQLRLAERQWIKGRDRYCRKASDEAAGGTLVGILYGDCIVTETIRRTIWLENLR